jgi:hypothetical protein
MVFNATFNNISVISWRSILLVEDTEFISQVCVPNTTKGSSNPAHGEPYSIQHVIQFVIGLQQVGGFLRCPPPIKLTATI